MLVLCQSSVACGLAYHLLSHVCGLRLKASPEKLMVIHTDNPHFVFVRLALDLCIMSRYLLAALSSTNGYNLRSSNHGIEIALLNVARHMICPAPSALPTPMILAARRRTSRLAGGSDGLALLSPASGAKGQNIRLQTTETTRIS